MSKKIIEKKLILLVLAALMVIAFMPSTADAATKVKKVSWRNAGSTMTLTLGSSFNFNTRCTPSRAKNKKVSYSSSNKSVATVRSNGVVYAKAKGTTIIKAKAKDGSKKYVTCKVTVGTRVTSLSWANSGSKRTITKGETFDFNSIASPSNASNKKVKYTSSNSSVASVSSSGVVKGRKNGTTTIKATTKDGTKKTVICTLTVGKKVSSLGWKNTDGSERIGYGKKFNLDSQSYPKDASNRTVTYKSSNTDVCTVDKSGVVTGVKSGNATITATTTDGTKKSVSCSIEIYNQLKTANGNSTYKYFTGHRGLRSSNPENTVQSFEAAANTDFYGIETDIWEVPDDNGTPDDNADDTIAFMIMHDETLERMCGTPLTIQSIKTDEDIKANPIVKGNGRVAGETYLIPKLSDYIKACGSKHMEIELKDEHISSAAASQLINMLSSQIENETVKFSSFNSDSLDELVNAAKKAGIESKLQTEYIISTDTSISEGINTAVSHGFTGLAPKYKMLTKDSIKSIHNNGKKVTTWTVNDVGTASKLIDWGVDGITSDYALWTL